MSRLEDLIQTLCPDGVKYTKLINACTDFIVPMRDRPKLFDGDIPWCRIEDIEGQYFHTSLSGHFVSKETISEMNLKVFPTGTVICSCSASLGVYAINTKPLITNQTFIGLVCGEALNNKFLRYFMETQTELLSMISNSGTIPYIPRKKFEDLVIPLPPLQVQQEIVRILDTFSDVVAELEAEQAARVRQYEHYRNTLFEPNQQSTQKTLGDIGKVCMCRRIFKEQTDTSGDVPFYKIGTFGKEPDAYITKELFEEYKSKFSYPKKGAILFSAAGTIGRTVIFDGVPAYFQDSNIVWIDNDETLVLNKYLFYFFSLGKWATSEGGTIARLYNYNITKTRISVPPLEVQEQIVSILDRFDALVNDLKNGLPAEIALRRKQYEYYRDKLLTFQPLK